MYGWGFVSSSFLVILCWYYIWSSLIVECSVKTEHNSIEVSELVMKMHELQCLQLYQHWYSRDSIGTTVKCTTYSSDKTFQINDINSIHFNSIQLNHITTLITAWIITIIIIIIIIIKSYNYNYYHVIKRQLSWVIKRKWNKMK